MYIRRISTRKYAGKYIKKPSALDSSCPRGSLLKRRWRVLLERRLGGLLVQLLGGLLVQLLGGLLDRWLRTLLGRVPRQGTLMVRRVGDARHAHGLRDQPIRRLASIDGLDIRGRARTHPTARRLNRCECPRDGWRWRLEIFLVASIVVAVLVPGRLLAAGPSLSVRRRAVPHSVRLAVPRSVRLLHTAQAGIQPGAGRAHGLGCLAGARAHRAGVGPHGLGLGQDAGRPARAKLGGFRSGGTDHARHRRRAGGGRLGRKWRAGRTGRTSRTLEPGGACGVEASERVESSCEDVPRGDRGQRPLCEQALSERRVRLTRRPWNARIRAV